MVVRQAIAWTAFALALVPAWAEPQCDLLAPAPGDTMRVAQFEPVMLQARLQEGGQPVSGSTVFMTAVVLRPDGAKERESLWDDGAAAHRDETAGDGVFSGVFAKSELVGTYSVTHVKTQVSGVERWHEMGRRFEVIGGPPKVQVSITQEEERPATGAVVLTVRLISSYTGGPQTVNLTTRSGIPTIDPETQVLEPAQPASATLTYPSESLSGLMSGHTLRDELIISTEVAQEELVTPIEQSVAYEPLLPTWVWLVIVIGVLGAGALTMLAITNRPVPLRGVLRISTTGSGTPPAGAPELSLTSLGKRRITFGSSSKCDVVLPGLPAHRNWALSSIREGNKRKLRFSCPPQGSSVSTLVDGVECTMSRTLDFDADTTIEIGDYRIRRTMF